VTFPNVAGDPLQLRGAAVPPSARVIGFAGEEAISSLYVYRVALGLSGGAELDMQAALGSSVTLVAASDTDDPMVRHGILQSVQMLEATGDRVVYVATLAPELWHLRHSVHSRIYTEVTIPRILEAVIATNGLTAVRYSLTESYALEEHVCQYRESDFDFISRLMERDGIYYFFEHAADATTLVITDHRSAQGSHEITTTYRPWDGNGEREEGLERFRCDVSALPQAVRIRDYAYLTPALSLDEQANVQANGRGEVVLYGENFSQPDQGQRRAKVKAEQYLTTQARFQGEGTVYGLQSGGRLMLGEHPVASMNKAYLVTRLRHWARQVQGIEVADAALALDAVGDSAIYRVQVDAIDDRVQFRAPLTHPWPRIDGVVDGVVDGPADSPYAQVDEHGRYKVKVFFDESDLVDGSGSTWIRMLQPHGGSVEGFHFPLRKVTEVHIIFLGGDPDRPVIVGVAPNAHKTSKITSANHTKNVIQTGGANRFEFEDQDGAQHVTMSTPTEATRIHMGAKLGDDYNFVTTTDGNARGYVGGFQDNHTMGYRTDRVTGYVDGLYEATVNNHIVGALTESYDDTHHRVVVGATSMALQSTLTEHVVGAVNRQEDATHDEQVEGAASYAFNATHALSVQGARTAHTVGTYDEQFDTHTSTTVGGDRSVAVTGSHLLASTTAQQMSAPLQLFAAEQDQVHTADAVSLEAQTALQGTAPATFLQGSDTLTLNSDGEVTIHGGKINIVSGEIIVGDGGTVTIQGGNVDVVGGLVKLN